MDRNVLVEFKLCMGGQNPVCKRCGRCCREAGGGSLRASDDDISRWRKQNRQDILSHADIFEFEGFSVADLWFDPITGEELYRCPFLKKCTNHYSCAIYETRPEQCQDWVCILSYPDLTKIEPGMQIPYGAHFYAVSNLTECSECGKRNICKLHDFISLTWLKNTHIKEQRKWETEMKLVQPLEYRK